MAHRPCRRILAVGSVDHMKKVLLILLIVGLLGFVAKKMVDGA
jgi:hypothetical protein